MPPKNSEPTDDQEPTGDQNEPEGGNSTDWEAEAKKWKSLSRKHEGQAKENAAAAKELAALKDADKSELQKALDKAAAEAKRAEAAEARAARYEVAAELGIKSKHLKYLSGSTREEIEESARGILGDFPEAYKDASADTDTGTPARPKERLRPGAAPSEEPDETDPRKLAASVPRL